MARGFFFLLFSLLSIEPLFCGVVWKKFSAEALPGVGVEAITNIGDYLYLSARASADGDDTRLWKSRDGESWEKVALPTPIVIQVFPKDSSTLVERYAFGVRYDATGTPYRSILVTYDKGSQWKLLESPALGVGEWSDATRYGGSALAAGKDGTLWEIYQGNLKPMSPPSAAGTELMALTIGGGKIYLAHHQMGTNPQSCVSYSDSFNISWRSGGCYSQSNPNRVALTVRYYDFIYWAHGLLTKTSTLDTPFWTDVSGFTLAPVALASSNFLFVIQPGNPISYMYQNTGIWQTTDFFTSVICDVRPEVYSEARNLAELPDRIFLLTCDLFMMRKGAVSASPAAYEALPLSYGQQNGIVLAWSMNVSVVDTLRQLTVRNRGTAAPGRDIAHLKLLRPSQDPVLNQPYEVLTELKPNSDNQTWSTAANFQRDFLSDDTLFLAVDVSVTPEPGTTCDFSVEAMSWDVSRNVSIPAPLTAIKAQEIQAGPGFVSQPLGKVVVAPTPAKDRVTFLYDLSDSSNVSIKIFDRSSTLVAHLQEPGKPADDRQVTVWDASRVAPGVYYATIEIESTSGGKKVYRQKIFIER